MERLTRDKEIKSRGKRYGMWRERSRSDEDGIGLELRVGSLGRRFEIVSGVCVQGFGLPPDFVRVALDENGSK